MSEIKHKKFMDIERFKTSFSDGFSVGDHIQMSEKIDGANAAIRYDTDNDCIIAQSRKNILGLGNNLRGFWEWSQILDKQKVKSVLGKNLVLFGEWLVPHSVKYPDNVYNKAYFYDIFDTETEEYYPQDKVKEIIDTLELNYVPVFYDGKFISWEHCMSFVGKTALGGEYGEGIVIKNQSKLNDKNTRLPFYTKIVGEKFAETKGHKVKTVDIDKLAEYEKNLELTKTIVTKARVHKILNKFIDERILPVDWGSKDMSTIAKNLTKAVYEDCIKEEPETVNQITDFGKNANKVAMGYVREILESK